MGVTLLAIWGQYSLCTLIRPIDMPPQTLHVETLVLLPKK